MQLWKAVNLRIILNMAGITLAIAQQKLDELLAAHTAVLAGQSVTIGGRTLTRAHLNFIEASITTWDMRVKRLSNGGRSGPRISYGIPS